MESTSYLIDDGNNLWLLIPEKVPSRRNNIHAFFPSHRRAERRIHDRNFPDNDQTSLVRLKGFNVWARTGRNRIAAIKRISPAQGAAASARNAAL